jgi:hypothetical protein
MSYNIKLYDPITKDILRSKLPHFMQGGTYTPGGTTELWLNITDNYSNIFYKLFGENGIKNIYGLTGAKSISLLEKAISSLKNDISCDYFEETEGNVKRVLNQLLSMAYMRPDGVWNE